MKVIIVLNDHLSYRTYIKTKSFNIIDKKFDVTYACSSLFKNKKLSNYKISGKKVIYFNISDHNRNLVYKISSLHFFSNLKKSLSYPYRYKRLLNFDILYNKNINLFKRGYLFFQNLLSKSNLWMVFYLPVISLKFLRNKFYNKYLNEIEIPSSVDNFLKKHNNEEIKIIVPSAGVDFFTISLDKLKRKYRNLKDIILINNWDNVSSKGAFWHQPNALVVWGDQTKKQAKDILGVKKNIFKLGTPSYLNFFRLRNKNIKKIYNFKYVLLAGPALPFDEISILHQLDKNISKNKIKLKIVYRPHPHRHKRSCVDNFFKEKFKNVILDNDAKKYYKKTQAKIIQNYTNLNYYPSLIKNAEFLIAPLSTMLLEGLIFYKKILVILHNDHFHYTTPARNFNNLEHLKILKNFSPLSYSYNFDDLEQSFLKTFKSFKYVNKKNYDRFLKKIVNNPKNFNKKLIKILSDI